MRQRLNPRRVWNADPAELVTRHESGKPTATSDQGRREHLPDLSNQLRRGSATIDPTTRGDRHAAA